MEVRFATNEEISKWDDLIINNPDGGNVFQTTEFAELKKNQHWQPLYVVYEEIYMLVLQKAVPLIGKLWYLPKGPGIDNLDKLIKLSHELVKFAKANSAFMIKFEPELLKTSIESAKLKKAGLHINNPIQAANTVIVDISKSIEEISANFTSKTRGNIRAGEKAGVKVELAPIDDDNCRFFYDMMNTTIAGRSHTRSYQYFKQFWQSYAKKEHGFFMFAKSGSDIVSVDFIVVLGHKATRKDAGSTRDHSIRGASAYLELEVIKYLKTLGVTKYDLFGSPPSDQIDNPKHPFYGFGKFKVGLNRQGVTDYIGCIDKPIKPLAYKLWVKWGEKIARKLHLIIYKDIYY